MTESKTKSLILLRGLPGSGKTTLANIISENKKWPCFSVDDYFTNENGDYVFNHLENHLAYEKCKSDTTTAMQSGIEKIIVHNTFTLNWELQPYFEMSKVFGYSIHIVTVENYHGHKNIHNITDEQLKKMAEKYKVKLY